VIIEVPDFVSRDVTARIRESVKPYKNRQEFYGTYRDGQTVNVSGTPELEVLNTELYEIFRSAHDNVIKRRYHPPYVSADSGYEYHCYNPGEVCHYHADEEVMEGRLRYASVVLHLNTIEKGGELVFPAQNKSVKTEEGKLVVFPPYSMFGHYTNPADVAREVVVTWFLYRDLRVEGS